MPTSFYIFTRNQLYKVHKILVIGILYFPCKSQSPYRQLIFTITTIAAVVTNAALVVFTMDYLDNHSLNFRFWFFCIFQWCIFGLLVILMESIPDIPTEISIQLQRQKILVEKVIFRIKDIEQSDSVDPNDVVPSPASTHFRIYDYPSFLQHHKVSPFTPRKQLSSMSQKLLDLQQSLVEESSDESPNISPMPTIYSLPSPKKSKYAYSRSGSNVGGGSSRILDDSLYNDEEFFENQA